ncbi:MAG: hypothetical protein HYY37_01025 [Candidatus Aenigmarchaeota archaeon]|nr:hypothetical protein [Candidatus Aenigmarchaeota archaeon]
MDINKFAAIGSVFTGLLFLLQAGILGYVMLQLSSGISALGALPGGEAIAGAVGPYIMVGWIFVALSLISGLISLIVGVMYFLQK